MRSDGVCSDCKSPTPTPEHRSTFVAIGQTVSTEIEFRKGHVREDHHFFQCPKCGSVWDNYKESGAGGHGNFWSRLSDF